jgi:AIPR protein
VHHPPTPALYNSGCRNWNQDIEDEAQWLVGALLTTEDAALRSACTARAAARPSPRRRPQLRRREASSCLGPHAQMTVRSWRPVTTKAIGIPPGPMTRTHWALPMTSPSATGSPGRDRAGGRRLRWSTGRTVREFPIGVRSVARNEQVLIDDAIKGAQDARPTPLDDGVAFELFTSEQVLTALDVSSEDVEEGRVGGSNDGALDGVFTFVGDRLLAEDDELLSDDTSPTASPKGLRIALWIIQSKRDEGFAETPVDLARDSLSRLLDLTKDDADLLNLYSPDVVGRFRLFKAVWQKLVTRHPRVDIHFAYCTRGATSTVNDKVRIKANELTATLKELVPGCSATVAFWGVAELWKSYSKTPSYNLKLDFKENATSGSSHVALVDLADYVDFLTDETGVLRRHVFDWNVRDYQGDVEVNREIRGSLTDASAPEFWWLNNGVTIVCSSAIIQGKTYILDDVQIVNGLQTSQTIYQVARSPGGALENRSVLVRILATQDPRVRDRVIRATNRQTSVPAASLRATDDVQRNIESYFASRDWYYDRRKNYYRNIGKAPARIISIPLLAQAVLAIGFSEASNSRARPSSLLKSDSDYARIFSSDIALPTYLWIAKTQRAVDEFLTSSAAGSTANERTNLRFYVSMLAVAIKFRGKIYNPGQLKKLAADDAEFTEPELRHSFEECRERAQTFCETKGWTLDRATKTSDFVQSVIRDEFGT